MALTVGDRPVRPLIADEVMDMVRAGILGEDDRVELLHGVLTATSAQHPPHAVVTQRLTTWLAPLMVAGRHDVRVRLPFRVPDETSLPEPDIAVVRRDDARIDHPREALLVIEVADSSLRVDTAVKPVLYASAEVPEYWVVDIRGRRVHVLAGPEDPAYAAQTVVEPPASVAPPAALDVAPLALDGLFDRL